MAWCRQAISHYKINVYPNICWHIPSQNHNELTSIYQSDGSTELPDYIPACQCQTVTHILRTYALINSSGTNIPERLLRFFIDPCHQNLLDILCHQYDNILSLINVLFVKRLVYMTTHNMCILRAKGQWYISGLSCNLKKMLTRCLDMSY